MKPKINKELLPMKAHYFLFNAGTAPVVPFMPTLARQLGFSTVVVGTIYTVLPIVGMLAKPLFGFIADRYQRHRLLFLIAEIITAISFFLIQFIPPIPQPSPTLQFHCHNGVSDLRYCSNYDTCIKTNLETFYNTQDINCHLKCKAEPFMWNIICEDWLKNNATEICTNHTNPPIDLTLDISMQHIEMNDINKCLYFILTKEQANINNETVIMNCPKEKPYFNTTCELTHCNSDYIINQLSESPIIKTSDAMDLYQFWLFFILLIISWIGMAVVVSIGDAICFAILGERHHLYGKQRLSGSIGFGLFAIIAGLLVDAMSGGNANKDYTIVFWMTAIIIGFDIFASSKLKQTQTHLSQNILKDVGQMFLSGRCVTFFVWCILIGLGTALIWNFLFWYLEDLGTQLEGCQNSMKTLEGFVMGIQCFGGELPFFFLSGWILKKIGHVNAMSLVLFGFSLRFFFYSLLTNPWYVLPIELLNGITFGLFYSTMASYASILAPPGTEATMQGLVGAIFEGVGVSTGSLIGGILFEVVGGAYTFEIFAICAFIAFIAHVCLQRFIFGTTDVTQQQNGGFKYLAPNDAMQMLRETDYYVH